MTESRFKTNPLDGRPGNGHPMAAGLCPWCLREMWLEVTTGSGLLRAMADLSACQPCHSWRQLNPGADPREARNTAAERILAEHAEPDPSWRDDAAQACHGLPPEMFAPEPDRSEPGYVAASDASRGETWEERHYVAFNVCAACPVRAACRATAAAMGYEGLWGGVFFDRWRWLDLLTGDKGETIHVHRGKGQEQKGAA